MATDITQYGDSELSNYFDNDESLYTAAMAATDFDELKDLADMVFTYTDDQFAEFKQDFEDGRWG